MRCEAAGWRQYPENGPITYEVPTEAGVHRVTWRAGRLTLHNHYSPRAEHVLRGLGGKPCPCLLALDALTEYGGDWAFDATARARARQVLEALANDRNFRDLPETERDAMLLRIQRRLAIQILPPAMTSVADHASQLRRNRHAQSHVSEQANRKGYPWEVASAILADTMRDVCGDVWRYAPVVAECWRQLHGESQLIYGALNKTYALAIVALRPAWINWVWRRDLAVVDGHFILDVSRPPPAESMFGQALCWELRPDDDWSAVMADCFLRRRSGKWELQWNA